VVGRSVVSRRPSGGGVNRDNYQLPHEDTVCGHLADGQPCAVGPGHCGECRVDQICQPWYDGTNWHCTRAKAFGGRCAEGPVPDVDNPTESASCPHLPAPCQPVRSLRSRRRLVSGLVAASALGVCLIILGGSSRNSRDSAFATTAIVSPGPLSAHHATMKEGCSACHSAAEQSATGLLSCVLGGSGGIEESQRCLRCHQELGEHALFPHSLQPTDLDGLATASDEHAHTTQQILSRMLATPPTTVTGELACATCHHEHRGAGFDLTTMTNAQCQSCHSSTFHSFSDGHPEFDDRQRAGLHFDHVTHLNLHFSSFERTMPDGVPRMKCQDCHISDSAGVSMKLQPFEVMCASCHGQQIGAPDAASSARLRDLVFLDWQETGTEASTYPPFMELLLDEGAANGISAENLISELAAEGEEAVRQRLHMAVDHRTESEMIEASIEALTRAYFFEAMNEFNKTDTADPAAYEGASYGSWKLSADGARMIYDCNQHADPVLRAWIDLAAANARQYPAAPAANAAGQFDRLLRDLAAPESTGRCMKCHTLEPRPEGGFAVNWNSRHGTQRSRDFTWFSHKPHLTLLARPEEVRAIGSDARCESCHTLDEDSFQLVNSAFVLTDGMPDPSEAGCAGVGFHTIRRRDCARCHTQQMAGDNCLQCHNYHIHRQSGSQHQHIESTSR